MKPGTIICQIALGANLTNATGAPVANLRRALELLEVETIDVRKVSPWYDTPAFPKGSGPNFVNAVAEIETAQSPEDLLSKLHRVEEKLGRTRSERWAARTCDLDLLTYGTNVLPNEKTFKYWRNLPEENRKNECPSELILPHPRIQDRAFVLVPLRDIAPDWRHPVSGCSVDALIAQLPQEDVALVKPLRE